MLFRRRQKANLWERVRVCLWPRRSFSRSLRYMSKRIVRISGSPHTIALGLAIGVCASFTPFFGFHIILAILVAWGFSANIAAAAIGTAFSNPLTMPFIFGMTYALGRLLWNAGDVSEPVSFIEFFHMLEMYNFADIRQTFFQVLFGSLVLGSVFGLMTYFIALSATCRFRRTRSLKLKMARHHQTLKQFSKTSSHFSDKNCGEGKEIGQAIDPSDIKASQEKSEQNRSGGAS